MSDPTQPTSVAGEALFLQFVQTVEDHAIFVMNPEELILYWNAGAQRIMGFGASDVVGRKLHDIFTQEDCDAGIPRLEIETAMRVGRAADERWHVRKDGSRFWGLGAVTPIRAADGTLLGFGKIVADRTDLKELQDTLQARNDALARADELKNRFLATLAHELRNPQSVLANSAGVLRRHAASDTQLRTVAEMIDRQVQQTQRLIEDLSDLARSVRGRIQLRLQRLDLRDIARVAAEAVQSAVAERRHLLGTSIADSPVLVDADADRIQQVIVNLLVNAARYTPPGGRISLSVAAEGEMGVVRVQDTGAGIPPEQLAEIFELFTQVHPENVESRAGMGIGLALARELVALHGGTIQARSDGLGKGSEFIVRLPLNAG
ncbi:MAG TPA: PAS domain-containing sensor histidine kinase [Steroidobacteraceae bacterium]|jgi:two-component system CheB/CheR fusion protein|nr:PAS domain-containing sensor histidine kinase [Steroidobacteraceae bacterium]